MELILKMRHLNSDVKSKQQRCREGQMELNDSGNSQSEALVSGELLLVLGSPLGDSWRAPRVSSDVLLNNFALLLKEFTWFGEVF